MQIPEESIFFILNKVPTISVPNSTKSHFDHPISDYSLTRSLGWDAEKVFFSRSETVVLRFNVAGCKYHHHRKNCNLNRYWSWPAAYLCKPPVDAVSTAWAPVTSTVNTKRRDADERHLAGFREIVLAARCQTISYRS